MPLSAGTQLVVALGCTQSQGRFVAPPPILVACSAEVNRAVAAGAMARRIVSAYAPDSAIVSGAGSSTQAGSSRQAASDERAAWAGLTRIGALCEVPLGPGRTPELAFLAVLRTTYGESATAYESDVVALVGHNIEVGRQVLGLHLNVGWTVRFAVLADERLHRYFVNVSLGQVVIATHTAIIATYLREQQARGERDRSMIQGGSRQRFPSLRATTGVAVGAGTNGDSPAFQVAIAFQAELGR